MHSKHLSQLATGTKDVSRGNFSWSNSWREPREYLMDSRVVVAEDEVISFRFVEEDGSFVVVVVFVVVFFFFGMNILFTMGKSLGKTSLSVPAVADARDDDDKEVKNTHTHTEREKRWATRSARTARCTRRKTRRRKRNSANDDDKAALTSDTSDCYSR